MWHRVRVAGNSMHPTLREGERLIVAMGAYRRRAPRTGDVVLAWHPDGSRKIVKRVAATPGQVWAGLRLGADEYYLRGDNPGGTTDSDRFGPVPRRALLGRVWFSYSRWRGVR